MVKSVWIYSIDMTYTFIGEDTFESYSYAKNLAKSLSTKNKIPLEVIESEDLSTISEVESLFQSVGMFYEGKVLLIKRFSQSKILSSYIYENISTVNEFEVVLWDDIKKLPAGKKLPNVKIYAQPKENEMRYWIKNFALKFGIKLDLALIDYFFTRFQFNKWQYFYELKKIKIYLDKHKISNINLELVERITGSESKGDIWKFLDYLFDKNIEKAYSEYKKLSSHEDVTQLILSLIEKELRNIYIYQISKEDPDLAKDLGIHPFVFKKLKGKASRFSIDKVKELTNKLIQSDYDIKTGNVEQNAAIQNFILQFT